MANDSEDWDLLSNGSGSDFYWPDSEVDDTLGLLDNMRFSESEEEESEDESESNREGDDSEVETKSVCDDSTLIGDMHEQDDGELTIDGTAANAIDEIAISPESHPTSVSHPPSQSPSSGESESTVPFIALDIMDGMTSLIEHSISSLLQILQSPQILSERDFVMHLLDNIELDCRNLQFHAHQRSQLDERLDGLLAKVIQCIESTGNCTSAPERTKPALQSETPKLTWRQKIESQNKENSDRIPEWRRRRGQITSTASVPASTEKGNEEAIHNLRDQFKALNNYKVCQCSSSKCRIHPSVFPESSNSAPKYLPPFYLREPEKSFATKEGHKVDKSVEAVRNGSWRKVQTYLDSVYGLDSYQEGSWGRVKKFLDDNYLGPSYEHRVCDTDGNRILLTTFC